MESSTFLSYSADLGGKNTSHRFLAKLETAGSVDSSGRGSMVGREGAGEELAARKKACAAKLRGGDGMPVGGESVGKGGAMSAVYSSCAGVGGGRGNGENGGLSGTSRTGEGTSVMSMGAGGDESASRKLSKKGFILTLLCNINMV